jgi:hypothetical protein
MWDTSTKRSMIARVEPLVPAFSPVRPREGEAVWLGGLHSHSPVRRALVEAAVESMADCAEETILQTWINPVRVVSQTFFLLSAMAMELGIILRLRTLDSNWSLLLDDEKLRRVINVLLIHLLSGSSAGAIVGVSVEGVSLAGRTGCGIRLFSQGAISAGLEDAWSDAYWLAHPELEVAKKMVERQGGRLSVLHNEDSHLCYEVWFAA